MSTPIVRRTLAEPQTYEQYAGPADPEQKAAELDELVDQVVDRIEQRVIDELERRGRRAQPGGF